jgi:hypothetical protein
MIEETMTGLLGGSSDARIFARVEGFGVSEDCPDGLSGLIALNPDLNEWRLILDRKVSGSPMLIRERRALAFTHKGKVFSLWILEHPWEQAPRLVSRLEPYTTPVWWYGASQFIVSFRRPMREQNEVWRFAPDGSEWVRMPFTLPRFHEVIDCSPDGQWLLVGNTSVEIIRPDGTDSRTLTPEGEAWIRPRFSPVGTQIVNVSTTHDGESLWIMNIDGSDRREIIPESPLTIVPRWSPDGSRLALRLCETVLGDKGWMTIPKDGSATPRI